MPDRGNRGRSGIVAAFLFFAGLAVVLMLADGLFRHAMAHTVADAFSHSAEAAAHNTIAVEEPALQPCDDCYHVDDGGGLDICARLCFSHYSIVLAIPTAMRLTQPIACERFSTGVALWRSFYADPVVPPPRKLS